MARYHSKHLHFELNKASVDMDNVTAFAQKCAQNFVAFTPYAREDTLVCYGSKSDGKEFNFKHGAISLAKKLRVNPKDVTLHYIRRNKKYPDSVFNLLDPTRVSEQIFYTAGKYAQEKVIKQYLDMALSQNENRAALSRVADNGVFDLLDPARVSEQLFYTAGKYAYEKAKKQYVDMALSQEKNRAALSLVLEKGVVKAVEEGLISRGEVRSYEAFQARKRAEEEKAERLGRDVERGKCIQLSFQKTDNVYHVESFKGDCSDQITSSFPVVQNETGDVVIKRTDEKAPQTAIFTKKKHHYFYSKKPGYGKTTTATELLHILNASALTDAKNWTDFDPDSQFIIVDEYGKSNRFAYDDLRRLTSGNASTFGGNRKSYGASVRPRADAQLILFSNYHLFECLGKRKITTNEEESLRDRFHIHKLDEEETRVSETEDGDSFVEWSSKDKYDEDWKSAKRCKYSQ